MFRMLILLMLVSCGKVDNGRDGINGISGENGLVGPSGLSYYSEVISVNLQEIVGDGIDEEAVINGASVYQLPNQFEINVDNERADCELLDLEVIFDTGSEVLTFIFQADPNSRYKMRLKSGPTGKVVDTSEITVYYKSAPEVDCGNAVYRLHSGMTFQMRLFKTLEIE